MRSTKAIHVVSCDAEGEVGDVILGGGQPPPGEMIWEQSRSSLAMRPWQAPGPSERWTAGQMRRSFAAVDLRK